MGFLLVYCEHYQQLSWLVTVLVPNPILNVKIDVSFEVLKCLNRNITKLKIYWPKFLSSHKLSRFWNANMTPYNSPCKKVSEN